MPAHRPFISASRRTDLPAWYTPWLIHRFRAGYCTVRNPFRPSQHWRVDLTPDAVSAVVFWTRDPAPLLSHLDELHGQGHNTVFQFTLTPYPEELEPGLRPLEQRLATCRRLAQQIGPERVWWRYDPIVLADAMDPTWHAARFEVLARQLAGATSRVTLSFLDYYQKTRRRLAPVKETYGIWTDQEGTQPAGELARRLATIARHHGITPYGCCEPSWQDHGIAPAACIDGLELARLFDLSVAVEQDKGQRTDCRCAPSFDIGAPHTCLGGCRYCYATSSQERAQANATAHDPLHDELLPFRGTPEKDG